MRMGNFDDMYAAPGPQRDTLRDVTTLIDNNYRSDIGRAPWWVYLKAADKLESVGL